MLYKYYHTYLSISRWYLYSWSILLNLILKAILKKLDLYSRVALEIKFSNSLLLKTYLGKVMCNFSLVEARSITDVDVVTAVAVFKFREVEWQLIDRGLSTECTSMSVLLLSFIGMIGIATDL